MAFDVKDFYSTYGKKGDNKCIFNVVREDTTSAVVQYYGYQNDEGSYIIQRSSTVTTTTVIKYDYYGKGVSKAADDFQTDWDNRASLTFVEYNALFTQGN